MDALEPNTALKDWIHQSISELSYYQKTESFMEANLAQLKKQVKPLNLEQASASQHVIDCERQLDKTEKLNPDLVDQSVDGIEVAKKVVSGVGMGVIGSIAGIFYGLFQLLKANIIVGIIGIVVLFFIVTHLVGLMGNIILLLFIVAIAIALYQIFKMKKENAAELARVRAELAKLQEYRKNLADAKDFEEEIQQKRQGLATMIDHQETHIQEFMAEFKKALQNKKLNLGLLPETFQTNEQRLLHAYVIIQDGAAKNWQETAAIVRNEEHLDKISDALTQQMTQLQQQIKDIANENMLQLVQINEAIDKNTGAIIDQTKTLKQSIEENTNAVQQQTQKLNQTVTEQTQQIKRNTQELQRQGKNITNAVNFQTGIDFLIGSGQLYVANATMERFYRKCPMSSLEQELLQG
ncbi:MAG: hypothetical protein DUD32_01465 [Lactobacillus sp.]|nr:MAG: hypothetical protein DUD32_01465 [Lactobacillus sp.]